jgi:hypothetical protein
VEAVVVMSVCFTLSCLLYFVALSVVFVVWAAGIAAGSCEVVVVVFCVCAGCGSCVVVDSVVLCAITGNDRANTTWPDSMTWLPVPLDLNTTARRPGLNH